MAKYGPIIKRWQLGHKQPMVVWKEMQSLWPSIMGARLNRLPISLAILGHGSLKQLHRLLPRSHRLSTHCPRIITKKWLRLTCPPRISSWKTLRQEHPSQVRVGIRISSHFSSLSRYRLSRATALCYGCPFDVPVLSLQYNSFPCRRNTLDLHKKRHQSPLTTPVASPCSTNLSKGVPVTSPKQCQVLLHSPSTAALSCEPSGK